MKRLCLIFRGENKRDYIKTISALENINNWREMLFNPLKTNNEYEYDIVFVTYDSDILEDLKKEVGPKDVIINNKENSSQVTLFSTVNEYIQEHKSIYDRFVILRFDIIYKLRITEWPKWSINSITVPCKDESWDSTKFYNDIVFIVDQGYYDVFNMAVEYMVNIKNTPIPQRISFHSEMPHHIGQYLHINKLKLDIMYEGLYNGVINHPLYIFTRTI